MNVVQVLHPIGIDQMRITCPHCGLRGHQEFIYAGSAEVSRPPADATPDMWQDFVHQRLNRAGIIHEYWQHSYGCRSVLIVQRNSLTHEITDVQFAQKAGVQK